METNERILKFIEYKGISTNAFEKSIGRSTNYVRNSKSFTSNVLATIMDIYPELAIEWLITGKGEMLKVDYTDKSPLVSNGSGTVGSVISGNVTGNGHNIGIIPADTEKELARAQWEAEHFKKENKNLKEQHKIEVSNLKEQLKQAIADKERALTMLDKALSK